MSEAKHTPGPWRTDPEFPGMVVVGETIDTHRGRSVMTIARVQGQALGTYRHNARLIAAAPELLAALEDAMEIIQIAKTYFPKSIKNRDRFRLLNIEANSIRPAIAKATGGKEGE